MSQREGEKKLSLLPGGEVVTNWAFGEVQQILKGGRGGSEPQTPLCSLCQEKLVGAHRREELLAASSEADQIVKAAQASYVPPEAEKDEDERPKIQIISFSTESREVIRTQGGFIVPLSGDSIVQMELARIKYSTPMQVGSHIQGAQKKYCGSNVSREVAFCLKQLYLSGSRNKTFRDQEDMMSGGWFSGRPEVRKFMAPARDMIELFYAMRELQLPFFQGWKARTSDVVIEYKNSKTFLGVRVYLENCKLRVEGYETHNTAQDTVAICLLEPREAFIQQVLRSTEEDRIKAFS